MHERILQVLDFFHPDAVVIQTGKKGAYGKDAIKQSLTEFVEHSGKTSMKATSEHYQMTTDYIIFSGTHETTTEKAGVIKGKFNQIWIKVNGKYLLLRDEYGPA
ncbi:hypothetical protein OESDEN_05424 [Oesophagostomum dentatum]|uniref:DUF4440 domain-containing protein n=1 Tax=Oesophagostomum dentatum TaxID=61180 RepID=A0A0B1TH03_OESDE|nr:hypothetical protein OESDEN_05424 [Oesophagostomum dentatum]